MMTVDMNDMKLIKLKADDRMDLVIDLIDLIEHKRQGWRQVGAVFFSASRWNVVMRKRRDRRGGKRG